MFHQIDVYFHVLNVLCSNAILEWHIKNNIKNTYVLKSQRYIAEATPIILDNSLEDHDRQTPASPDVARRYLHLLELSLDTHPQIPEDSFLSEVSTIPTEEVPSINNETYILEDPSVIILDSSMEEDWAVVPFFLFWSLFWDVVCVIVSFCLLYFLYLN